MIDLHSHILPRVDDGAKDERTALAMLAAAAAGGTRAIVATPHVIGGDWLPQWEDIVAGCQRLTALAASGGIRLAIHPGAEVAVHPDLLPLLTLPGQYCLGGSRYILLELPASHIPAYADEFFFTLQTRGFLPVIAHPERNAELARRPDYLYAWVERGMLVQINAASLTGHMGERVGKFAARLVAERLVHCLGSDAHGLRVRHPDISAAAARLAALAGAAAAKEILGITPAKILQDRELGLTGRGPDRTRRGSTSSWLHWLGRQ